MDVILVTGGNLFVSKVLVYTCEVLSVYVVLIVVLYK